MKTIVALATLLSVATLVHAAEPEMVRAKRKPADSWTEYPTRTLAQLPPLPDRTIPLDPYGGRADQKLKATGFFRTEKLPNGRWTLVTPDGHPFIHMAIVALAPKGSPRINANFEKKYGSPSAWADQTLGQLRAWGFNGAGAWSDAAAIRSARQPVAYTILTGWMEDFAGAMKLTHVQPGNKGYVNRAWPVFHPEFEPFCRERARALTANASDPWLVGYFTDNEMPYPEIKNYLTIDPVAHPVLKTTHEAARAWWLARNGGQEKDPATATQEDRDAFGQFIYEKYYDVTTRAIRAADPNHLCLGSRLHFKDIKNAGAWLAAAKYLDVVSMNYYTVWTPQAEHMNNWAKWSGKPFMITEWYTKGDDAGFPNTSGAGWIVPTQADRGRFYQNYTLALLENKSCVGWHWFKYKDNDLEDKNAEPSNRDSNKGLVRVDFTEYTPLAEAMKQLNDKVYQLVDYFDGK